MPEQAQQRQVAIKARIGDILSGQYIVEEGWNPNYVLTKQGMKISRVNLLGAIISSPTVEANYRNVMLDDGTGNISIRSFDETDLFKEVSLGDAVFIIGRPRQYGNEVYIMPEIVKKVQDKLWIEIRKKELEKIPNNTVISENSESVDKTPTIDEVQPFHSAAEEIDGGKVVEEEISDSAEKTEVTVQNNEKVESENPKQKIYTLIKELDKGDGALFEEILEKAGQEDTEKIISQLLMEGEIFELGKGKLKVLE